MIVQRFKAESVLSHHALLGRNGEQLGHIKVSETFDVERTAFLIGFMVELGVDLCNLVSFLELPRLFDIVDAFFHAPLDEIPPHFLHVNKYKLTRAREPEVIIVIKAFLWIVSSQLSPFFELLHH
jgi:hypothetical protein